MDGGTLVRTLCSRGRSTVCGNLRQLGKERGSAVNDSSPLERVAAVATDYYLTLDVGFGSEQLVLRMNAKSPFPPNRRSDNSDLALYPKIVESLVRSVRLDNAQ